MIFAMFILYGPCACMQAICDNLVKIWHMSLNSIDMITYSQYYSQFVKDHEKELNVLLTSYPKDNATDAGDGVTVAAE